jgi:hypothetical protein
VSSELKRELSKVLWKKLPTPILGAMILCVTALFPGAPVWVAFLLSVYFLACTVAAFGLRTPEGGFIGVLATLTLGAQLVGVFIVVGVIVVVVIVVAATLFEIAAESPWTLAPLGLLLAAGLWLSRYPAGNRALRYLALVSYIVICIVIAVLGVGMFGMALSERTEPLAALLGFGLLVVGGGGVFLKGEVRSRLFHNYPVQQPAHQPRQLPSRESSSPRDEPATADDEIDVVSFITVADGNDLAVSFAIADHEPGEIVSLTVLRTPKSEALLAVDQRGVFVAYDAADGDEQDRLRRFAIRGSEAAIETSRTKYMLDLSEIPHESLASAQRTLSKMNFDQAFVLDLTEMKR